MRGRFFKGKGASNVVSTIIHKAVNSYLQKNCEVSPQQTVDLETVRVHIFDVDF